MTHEIGHNLGMDHDFKINKVTCKSEDDLSGKPCNECANWDGRKLTEQTDASGECCTGIMDYGRYKPESWSSCSVRNFEQHYVSENWAECMPAGKV